MERPGDPASRGALTEWAVEIAAAYVSNNAIETSQLGGLIVSVFKALDALGTDEPDVAAGAEPLRPAVPIKKSITPDYLICLEDGKKLKMLKRYLRSTYGMTPDQYRARWALGPDYPMVAPNYAAQRSAFAKEIGLGKGVGRSKGGRRGGRTRTGTA